MLKMIFILIVLPWTVLRSYAQEEMVKESDTVMVLWTSGDREVAEKVCFMYTYNAKRAQWFDEVYLVVWGPSAKLLTEDKELQAYIKKMQDLGVIVEACHYCANLYGVVDELKALGIDVKGMGVPLSERLKAGWKQLNF